MTRLSNFHTHSLYCDGKNSPEEMVREALALGCPAIGFSGHSFVPFDSGYCMDPDRETRYIREVRRLQQVYGEKIRICLGIEQDYYSAPARADYEYRIGSVHYVRKDGKYISIDETPEKLKDGVDRLYGGDFYAFTEDYYTLEADVIRKTGCDIVGHFDLVTKFLEKQPLFDETHPRYRQAALSALDALLDQGALLEVNTGAISRGWRTQAYPADFLLEEIGRRGTRVILSSDAHRREDLLFGLEDARARCRAFHVKTVSF